MNTRVHNTCTSQLHRRCVTHPPCARTTRYDDGYLGHFTVNAKPTRKYKMHTRSLFPTTLGEIIKTYNVGRSFVTSPKNVNKTELIHLQQSSMKCLFYSSMQITVQLDRTYKKAWSLHMEFGRDRTWLQAKYFTRGTEGLTSLITCLCHVVHGCSMKLFQTFHTVRVTVHHSPKQYVGQH